MEPKKEFIYILTNPSFTGMVKIGRSKDVAKRLKTFETGVPTPFKCEYCCEVEDAQRVENAFKVIFRPYRIKGKEFYEILPYQAAEVLRLIGGKDQAERFNAEEEKQIPVQSKSPQFKFADMGINLSFSSLIRERLEVSDNPNEYNHHVNNKFVMDVFKKMVAHVNKRLLIK